jgi:hypothetical protein
MRCPDRISEGRQRKKHRENVIGTKWEWLEWDLLDICGYGQLEGIPRMSIICPA